MLMFHDLLVVNPQIVADVLEEESVLPMRTDSVLLMTQIQAVSRTSLNPEMQKRGLLKIEYAVPCENMRENLLRQPGKAN
jgi:hypothetical protein